MHEPMTMSSGVGVRSEISTTGIPVDRILHRMVTCLKSLSAAATPSSFFLPARHTLQKGWPGTVRIDKKAIGVRTAEALLARAAGRRLDQTVIDVGFELIERQST
jgi:hypothetical protein